MAVDWDEWAKEHYHNAAVLLDAADIFTEFKMFLASKDARWLASELIAMADDYTMRSGSDPAQ